MSKRRSTVYVRPGKDVTLYIPSDTPPQVIEYLNRLKMEGAFSQGIMDILTRHICEGRAGREPADRNLELEPDEWSPHHSAGIEAETDFVDESTESNESIFLHNDVQESYSAVSPGQQRFNLDQIFRQARLNSEKV